MSAPEPPDDLLVRRLRASLDARAEQTSTAPDSWARIDARARGWRRPRRVGTAAVAAVAVTALVVAGVALSGDDGGDGDITAADLGPGGLLRLVPGELPEGYALASVRDEAVAAPTPQGDASLVVGPPPADGELASRFVHVVAYPADLTAPIPASDAVTLDPATGSALSAWATPSVDPATGDISQVVRLGDLDVAVFGRGVEPADVDAVVAGLVPVDPPVAGRARVTATDLPAGWATLYEGSLAELFAQGASSTVEYVQAEPGLPTATITISVSRAVDDPDLSLQPLVDGYGYAVWTDVRGHAAVAVLVEPPVAPADDAGAVATYALPAATTTLRWVEEPGTLVEVSGAVDLDTARAVADGLVVVDETRWRDLYALTAAAPVGRATAGGSGATGGTTGTGAWTVVSG